MRDNHHAKAMVDSVLHDIKGQRLEHEVTAPTPTPTAGCRGNRARSESRWRRRESNPRPQSRCSGFYERIRRSDLAPRLASPAGLLGASLLKMSPHWQRRTAGGEPAYLIRVTRGRLAGARTSLA